MSAAPQDIATDIRTLSSLVNKLCESAAEAIALRESIQSRACAAVEPQRWDALNARRARIGQALDTLMRPLGELTLRKPVSLDPTVIASLITDITTATEISATTMELQRRRETELREAQRERERRHGLVPVTITIGAAGAKEAT